MKTNLRISYDENFSEEENKLLKLYINEYNDVFQKILILTPVEFLQNVRKRVDIALKSKFNGISQDIRRKIEDHLTSKIYSTDYKFANLVKRTIEKKIAKNMELHYFQGEILEHCESDKKDGFFIHSCGEKFFQFKYKKSILTKSDLNDDTMDYFLYCSKCEMIYKSDLIKFKCNTSGTDFYSKILIQSNDEENMPYATWKKYHCNAVVNDVMRCKKCQSRFFFIKDKNSLYCKNCKNYTDPLTYYVKCLVCQKEFSSEAKAYNPLDYKNLKICVKDAIIGRVKAKPEMLGCQCDFNIHSTKFFHKNKCSGELFLGEFNGKKVVVCNKCDSIGMYEGYVWTCPKCMKKFKVVSCDENKHKKEKTLEEFIYNKENIKDNEPNSSNSANIQEKCEENVKFDKKSPERSSKEFQPTSRNKEININQVNPYLNSKDESKKFNKKYAYCLINSNSKDEMRFLNRCKSGIKLECIETKLENTNYNSNQVFKDLSPCKSNYKSFLKSPSTKNILNVAVKTDIKTDIATKIPSSRSPLSALKKKNLIGYFASLGNKNEKDNLSKKLFDNNNDVKKFESSLRISPKKNNLANDSIKEDKFNNTGFPPSSKLHNKNSESTTSETSSNKTSNINQIPISNNNLSKKNSSYNSPKKSPRKSPVNSPIVTPNKISDKKSPKKTPKNSPFKYSNKLDKCSPQQSKKDPEPANKITADNKSPEKKVEKVEKAEKKENPKNLRMTIEELSEGFDVNNFKIIKQIGQGSFGKIYMVQSKNTQKLFALKKLIATSAGEIKSLEGEYQILLDAQTQEKDIDIVKIYGMQTKQLDSTTYCIYVLMEIANTDWEKEILTRQKTKKYYSEKELLTILGRLTKTFAKLQKLNISHRDIKPQNILVFSDTNMHKLADFGEAKELFQDIRPTNRQTLRGTELYMSPILFYALRSRQVIKYVKHNPYKSDVFSFGLCAFFAATLCFESLYDVRELKNNLSIKVVVERYLRRRYTEKVINIIAKMMDVNENTRDDFISLEKEFESIGY